MSKFVDEPNEGLAEFQKANCLDCKFADKKFAGKGVPCCTYFARLIVDNNGVCQSKRIKEGGKS